MKAKLLKALAKCCGKPESKLDAVVVRANSVYTSDCYVVVRVVLEGDPAPDGGWLEIPLDVVRKLPASGKVDVHALAVDRERDTPDFERFFETVKDKASCQRWYEPKDMSRIASVFKEAGFPMTPMVMGDYAWWHGYGDGIVVDAVTGRVLHNG